MTEQEHPFFTGASADAATAAAAAAAADNDDGAVETAENLQNGVGKAWNDMC
jgi:hypothetical protein